MSDTAPVAETIVGLLLVVIFAISWFVGEIAMSMLSMVLLTGLALGRLWVRV